MVDHLDKLEGQSIYILREAYNRFKNPGVLWSIGKDSTVLLWLCKKAFFGKIPFKIFHIDTEYKFKEIYEFREKLAKQWGLDLNISKNMDAINNGITPDKSKFHCCNARKTQALKQMLNEHKIDGLLVGIRRDEHGIRNKERYFSPRDRNFNWNIVKEKKSMEEGDSPFESQQDTELHGWGLYATTFGEYTDHVRVHPLLHWTELDIWEYIKRENIPTVSLYFSKNNRRYRSIGCECCCTSIESKADDIDKIIKELKITNLPERFGRKQDMEDDNALQNLRLLGYM